MNRRSRRSVLVAAVLAALLLLMIILPLILESANAAVHPLSYYTGLGLPPPQPYVDPGNNCRYFENVYSSDDAADTGYYHGVPVINSLSMSFSGDGNVKLGVNARYRSKLSYCWQVWSDAGTANSVDDGWANVEEATETSFRPADFLKPGNHMVRVAVTHAGSGSVVSAPIIITVEDGAGDNPGFTGSMDDLIKSVRSNGYYSAAFATENGLIGKALEN